MPEPPHNVAAHPPRSHPHGNRTQARCELGAEPVLVRRVGKPDQVDRRIEPVDDHRLRWSDQQYLGLFSGHAFAPSHISIETGCSAKFLNAAMSSAPSAPSTTR